MREKKLTILDIAKALGLSKSTVGRALGGGDISPKTKSIILDYIQTVEFIRNESAYLLRKKKSNSIGVIVPEISNNFYAQIIDGIEYFAHMYNYNTVITQSNDAHDRELQLIKHLVNSTVDGLLISLSKQTFALETLSAMQERGLPVVFFDRVPSESNYHSVEVENYKGAYQGTEFLIKLGCRRILHITDALELVNSRERLRGFRDCISQYDYNLSDDFLLVSDQTEVIKHQLISKLRGSSSIDGIFIAHEKLTEFTLLALKQLGLKEYPKIVGFSNSTIVEMFSPAINNIIQPANEMGQKATSILIELINSKEAPKAFYRELLHTHSRLS